MKKSLLNSVLTLLFLCLNVTAQVGINTKDPKSILDIPASNIHTPANTDGILIPRVNVFPITNPNSDQDGMLIFLNQNIAGFQRGFHYWDNTDSNWIAMKSGEWSNGTNGDGENLIYATQANSNGNNIIITNDGRIGLGTDDPVEKFEIKGSGDNDIQITSANTNPPNLIFYNTGGTISNPGVLNTNQEIGSLISKTHDGSRTIENGGIRFYIDGTPSFGNTPSKFAITTLPPNSTTKEETFTIRSSGNVGLSEINPTATLHLRAGTNNVNSAPLKFTAGTNLSTPETGAMEYDGTNLYFTPNSTREVILTGLRATSTLNFPSIGLNDNVELTVNVTGATLGMSCSCSPRENIENGVFWNCYVSSSNTVTIRLTNALNSPIDPDNKQWTITLIE